MCVKTKCPFVTVVWLGEVYIRNKRKYCEALFENFHFGKMKFQIVMLNEKFSIIIQTWEKCMAGVGRVPGNQLTQFLVFLLLYSTPLSLPSHFPSFFSIHFLSTTSQYPFYPPSPTPASSQPISFHKQQIFISCWNMFFSFSVKWFFLLNFTLFTNKINFLSFSLFFI